MRLKPLPIPYQNRATAISEVHHHFCGFLASLIFSRSHHVVWQDLSFQLLRAHLRFPPGPLTRRSRLPSASRGTLVCTNCLSSASQNQLERSNTHTADEKEVVGKDLWGGATAHFMAEGKACPFDIWWWLISMASHIGGWVPSIT